MLKNYLETCLAAVGYNLRNFYPLLFSYIRVYYVFMLLYSQLELTWEKFLIIFAFCELYELYAFCFGTLLIKHPSRIRLLLELVNDSGNEKVFFHPNKFQTIMCFCCEYGIASSILSIAFTKLFNRLAAMEIIPRCH